MSCWMNTFVKPAKEFGKITGGNSVRMSKSERQELMKSRKAKANIDAQGNLKKRKRGSNETSQNNDGLEAGSHSGRDGQKGSAGREAVGQEKLVSPAVTSVAKAAGTEVPKRAKRVKAM